MNHTKIQNIAKQTIDFAKQNIKAGISLCQVRQMLEAKMLTLGATSFWYCDVGAFVFAGDETAISLSGSNYKTSNKIILENDIVTIDLSPQVCIKTGNQTKNIWGDFARTLVIQNGIVAETQQIKNAEWKNGILQEEILHRTMQNFVKPATTFEDLYFYMNNQIANAGYVNLDFLGNLGHSIANTKDERIYIEKGNKTRLADVPYLTFESHIRDRKSVV